LIAKGQLKAVDLPQIGASAQRLIESASRAKMFDSNLCDRPFPERPFFVEWFAFVWFNKPLFLALSLLSLFVISWLGWHVRWKFRLKSKTAFWWLFGVTASVLILFAVTDKALLAFLPTNSRTPAEAIVVLGRGPLFNKERVERTAELWQARRAPMIFVSGRGDAPILIEELEAEGIPKTVLDGENCSVTTKENAALTAAVLQPQGIRRIVLVTDWPHMWRSLLVFRAYGFTVISQTSELPPAISGIRGKLFLRIREYTALVSYGLRGLYFSKRSPESDNPELVNLIQKAEGYAQQQRLKE
jgi:uncharacterized SAM-binding protein YcdF (DUF218 family)